ncbi:hypothetical protein CQA49_06635 [Helicobacter sp. MIT 00-7814]|uniref:hypothetical protein n=1 Tax=unclassified Helicobacter TaxID=2593540 RepID=UPI000E1F90B2|nr:MULTISPECIES: hypothetical protein [unclassified Helicobacter]RDU53319.1 hypothetical protein CQA49_06635 [Helicobacter sp. MIT 00-7814]RDU54140.1 hypothetical protein CQA37_05875 [Helicobacter sp. MIT 99-10781]
MINTTNGKMYEIEGRECFLCEADTGLPYRYLLIYVKISHEERAILDEKLKDVKANTLYEKINIVLGDRLMNPLTTLETLESLLPSYEDNVGYVDDGCLLGTNLGLSFNVKNEDNLNWNYGYFCARNIHREVTKLLDNQTKDHDEAK